jgi:hypothetical protein
MNNIKLSLKSISQHNFNFGELSQTYKDLVYPKMMVLCPPSDQVKIKGVPKGGTKAATKKSSYSHEK